MQELKISSMHERSRTRRVSRALWIPLAAIAIGGASLPLWLRANARHPSTIERFHTFDGAIFTYATGASRITSSEQALFAVCLTSTPQLFESTFELRYRMHRRPAERKLEPWHTARLRGSSRFLRDSRSRIGPGSDPILLADDRDRLHLLFPVTIRRRSDGRPLLYSTREHNLRHWILDARDIASGELSMQDRAIPATILRTAGSSGRDANPSFEARKLTATFSRFDRSIYVAMQVLDHTDIFDSTHPGERTWENAAGYYVARFDTKSDRWSSMQAVPRLAGDPAPQRAIHGYDTIVSDPRNGRLSLTYTLYEQTQTDGPYRVVRVTHSPAGGHRFSRPVEVCRSSGASRCYPVDAILDEAGSFTLLFKVDARDQMKVYGKNGKELTTGFYLACERDGFEPRLLVADDGRVPSGVGANLIRRGGGVVAAAALDGQLAFWRSDDRGRSWQRLEPIPRDELEFAGRFGAYNPMLLKRQNFASRGADRRVGDAIIGIVTDLDTYKGTRARQRLLSFERE